MNYLKQALIVTALFSCMSTIAQEEKPKTSRATTIVKCADHVVIIAQKKQSKPSVSIAICYAGLASATFLSTLATASLAYKCFKKDLSLAAHVSSLARIMGTLTLVTGTIAYQEGKKALFNNNNKDINNETIK